MKTKIKTRGFLRLSFVFVLLLSMLFSFSSCENKREEPPQDDDNSIIIIKKDEPLIKKKEPKYSYPPNVKSVDLRKYTAIQIDTMAQELDIKGFYEGNKLYYKNSKHMIFLPEQIPTIYENKEKYFEEINELW